MALKLPQAYDRETTIRIHLSFLVALVAVVLLAAWLHGWPVLVNAGLAVATAAGCDEGLRYLRRSTGPRDWGSLVWGLLLSLLLPANAPFYLPVVGAAFAVLGVKGLLGGGTPWINPVLTAWAFLQAGWPQDFPSLTPLVNDLRSAFDQQGTDWLNTNIFSWLSIQLPGGYLDLVTGLGRPDTALVVESGSLMLLGTTVFLLAKGYFPWQVPTLFFLSFCLPLALSGGNLLYQVFSGALLLNLFFLASDPASRPLGRSSLIIFSVGAGLLSFLVRTWGTGPDGVGYAVLFMNLLVPCLDQMRKRKSLNDFRLA